MTDTPNRVGQPSRSTESLDSVARTDGRTDRTNEETNYDELSFSPNASRAGGLDESLSSVARTALAERVCAGCRLPTPMRGGPNPYPRKWCSDECRSATRNAARRAPRVIREPAERVREKLVRNEETGCLEFGGYRNARGYGVIQIGGNQNPLTALAHRVVWEATNGRIADGLELRHKCDNPPCCLIEHLEVGTHLDNMRDRDERGRTLRGEAVGRYSDSEIRQVRELLAAGATYRAVSQATGVSQGHIAYIKQRPEWRTS